MKIKIFNFVQINRVDIDLEDKFHFVFGRNEVTLGADSNGSGKSLFIDAIVYALYGTSLRKLKLDNLVGAYADYMFTEIELETKVGLLRVKRGRGKYNVLQIWVCGSLIEFQKKSQYNQFIIDALGIDYDTFLLCGYYGEFGSSLLSSTPSDRAKKVLSIIEYDIQTHNQIDISIKDTSTDAAKESELNGRLASQYQDELNNISDLPTVVRTLSEYKEIKKKYENIKDQYETLKKKVDELNSKEVDGFLLKGKTLDDYIEYKKQKTEELSSIREEIGSILSELEKKEKEKNDVINKIKSDFLSYDSAIDEYLNITSSRYLDNLKSIIASNSLKQKELLRDIDRNEKSILQLDALIDKYINSAGVCIECGQSIQHTHDDKIISIRSDKDEIKEKINSYNLKIKKIEDESESINQDLVLIKERSVSISHQLSQELKIDDVALYLSKGKHFLLNNIIESGTKIINDELQVINGSKLRLMKLSDDSIKTIKDVDAVISRHQTIIKDTEEYKKRLEETIESGKKLKALLAASKQAHINAKDENKKYIDKLTKELSAKIKDKTAESLTMKEISDFGDIIRKILRAYKAKISADFMSRLQNRMNSFFMEMGSSLYAVFAYNEGEIEMLFSDASKGDKLLEYNAFSRGERTRIEKALFWLMVDLFKPALVLADESNDGLDEEGLKAVLKFSSKRFNSKLYLEVSPIKYTFEGDETVPVIECVKKNNDGVTLIEITKEDSND